MRDAIQHHTALPEGTKYSVLVVTPGDWKKVGEKWEQQAHDQQLAVSLIDAAKKVLGSDVQSKILPYSEAQEFGKSSAFIVRFNSGAAKAVSYETHDTHFGSLPLKD